MKIYHYNDEYSEKNSGTGVKEFIFALIIGVLGTIIPAVLMGLGVLNFLLGSLIIIIAIIIVATLISKVGIYNKASMSVVIKQDNKMFYMMVTPNLEGSAIPKSFTALLAGKSATFVENKIDAEVFASNLAQNDEFITQLFDLYLNDKIKTTFDTAMYGKPCYVYEILNPETFSEYKKIYKVRTIENKKKKITIKIPNSYPGIN